MPEALGRAVEGHAQVLGDLVVAARAQREEAGVVGDRHRRAAVGQGGARRPDDAVGEENTPTLRTKLPTPQVYPLFSLKRLRGSQAA